ncbi:MAG TPA: lysophospholipid acyltransferase family protein [Candidatus Binatia bacterium]|nr:lysophospholipid acyltransferase family protein [Candidatus Binatia bacterium]
MTGSRRARIRVALLGFAARYLYGLVKSTVRPVVGPDAREVLAAFENNERVVIAFWHGQLAMLQAGYRGRGAGICVQVSHHSDGEIITRAVRPFGIRAARGSATRGGLASVREMIEAHRQGYDLALAPDGPRGPIHRAKPGAIRLAQATGARLFPVACAPRRGVVFRSWDRFTVPLPFTRVYYVVGAPLSVPRDADEGAIERARLALEEELSRTTREAERRARTGE